MCASPLALINVAYLVLADGHFHPPPLPEIEGGPAWIRSESYQVNAKAEDDHASQELMRGTMMQALLEDRFKVKVHRESREAPVYVLTVTKGGPKFKASKQGTCVPGYFSAPPAQPVEPDRQCPLPPPEQKGANWAMEWPGMSMDEFSRTLFPLVQRLVLDKTGLSGRFDLHLEYAPELGVMSPPRAGDYDPTGGTSIFTAVQEQLGLKLDSAKGSREILVIDHVERPSEN